ncbi:hypothetical protein LEP1GSC034_1535 [Leptospira interrogans str. 2003000735]|uniref:Uncharacterized protein n=1 Tax=Leptospira interrogans serovar Lora str. TE 1992 TaxID=1193028 RepID=M3EZN4_LEPIR|nr:hypothetical protein [Leptospira interrogans]EMF43862.1 hypothetical protein LEP1GSC067_1705 [Leptospira interrogans serovar Lora str. TE 1992]MCR8637605.1 hypothetical protein [Leptospira interrogans serovar Ricardi]EKN87576.1 hypothetical protein LEP1GSC027_3717 [Leptospira interrogans str. 2002000624]EKQ38875.1 hypothetical protein LEP1GSC025_3313 [Leptospira interrogans str. 2002000621]EKQ49852.1 hypothetical protein LEP1GSC026_0929 [Leptospira interrogans str. 2002000623]
MGPRKTKSERGPSGNIHHKKIRFRLELFLKSVSNIPNLESIFSSTKKIIGDYMKRKPYWKILISTFLILGMMNCSQSKDDGNEDVLLLLGIAAQNYWEIEGTWNYFNGTKNYAGDLFNENGTTLVGQYIINKTQITREIKDTGFGGSKLIGNVMEIDRSKRVVYVQFTQDSSFSKGKFAWYRWTSKDGYYYICPDLSGVNNQNTLDQAKADNLDNFSDTTNMNAGCGLNSGFAPGPWSRLEIQTN